MLLLIHCLMFLPLFMGMDSVFGPCFVMHYLVLFLVFAIVLTRKRELVSLL